MGSSDFSQETIAAIATANGKGGIGIVRLSGKHAKKIGQSICQKTLQPRKVIFSDFKNQAGQVIDQGVVLYFSAPNSFTGEDVVELQGHGGPVVMDSVLQQCVSFGAQIAQPGEFSQRAFLNDKMDLTQAEAIADLIDSTSQKAAVAAMHSLQGVFSQYIGDLLEKIIRLRVHVEAAIDFPEEEIDFLKDEAIQEQLSTVTQQVERCLQQTQQGALLKNGLKIVLAGAPNAGKSSLLNALSGLDSAIVTSKAGTTRDTIEVSVQTRGFVVHLTDTAGIRQSQDVIEKIGIEKAHQAMQKADHILYIMDAGHCSGVLTQLNALYNRYDEKKITPIWNKCDLNTGSKDIKALSISAKTQQGFEDLWSYIEQLAHCSIETDTPFTARSRHVNALKQCLDALQKAQVQLSEYYAGELVAQELLQAQQYLNRITGEYSSDDLLGEIFQGFCIGK